MRPDTDAAAAFIAGFTAGEGSFIETERQTRFAFAVELGAIDEGMCQFLRDFFRVGTLVWSKRRKPHYDDECAYRVQSLRELIEVVVPFMDAHLPPSYKREQYEAWKAHLLEYWEHKAKRVRPCRIEGCEAPRRARGLCRHHYFLRYAR